MPPITPIEAGSPVPKHILASLWAPPPPLLHTPHLSHRVQLLGEEAEQVGAADERAEAIEGAVG